MSEVKNGNTVGTENVNNAGNRSPYSQNNVYEIDLVKLIMVYVKKWLLLGIMSAAVAILVFAAMTFYVNRNARKYTISFNFDFPNIETGRYPNGAEYSHLDFIKEDHINYVIEKNPDLFGNLDASKVQDNLFVDIEKETVDGVESWNGKIVFTGKAKFFSDSDQFRSFTKALVQYIVDSIREMPITENYYYYYYLDAFDSASNFRMKLDYLLSQKTTMLGKYKEWSEKYGEQYTVDDHSLAYYSTQLENAFPQKNYEDLNYELEKNQYSLKTDNDEVEIVKIQIGLLEDEKEDNEKKIAELTAALESLRASEKNSTSDITGKSNEANYYDSIAKYTERQVDIDREIKNLNIKIKNMTASAETAAYNNKLNAVRSTLGTQAEILAKVAAKILYDKTNATFDMSTFDTIGTKSSVLFAGAAFVVVYIMAGFIVFIIESDKERNNRQ